MDFLRLRLRGIGRKFVYTEIEKPFSSKVTLDSNCPLWVVLIVETRNTMIFCFIVVAVGHCSVTPLVSAVRGRGLLFVGTVNLMKDSNKLKNIFQCQE